MSKYHSYDEFEKAYLGVGIDYDGTAGYQCVDVVDQYWKDLFDITGVWCNGARDLYRNFYNYPALVKNFNRIPNTRSLIVQKGDIVIWDGGTWGHVAIGNGEGNIDWFISLEQNTLGKREKTQLVKHYFNGFAKNDCCNPVLGVLRAKDQTRVLGKSLKGDVNNDQEINVTDVSMLSAHVKSKKALTKEQQKNADINGDGAIDVTDLSATIAQVKGIKPIKQD